jgi:soluble lytic murein transglycosylase-like protein
MKRLYILLLIFSQSVFANCWESAHYYHVDPYCYAIAKVESGMNPYAVGWNHDGTRDVGLMQINSSHFSELERGD